MSSESSIRGPKSSESTQVGMGRCCLAEQSRQLQCHLTSGLQPVVECSTASSRCCALGPPFVNLQFVGIDSQINFMDRSPRRPPPHAPHGLRRVFEHRLWWRFLNIQLSAHLSPICHDGDLLQGRRSPPAPEIVTGTGTTRCVDCCVPFAPGWQW